MNRVVGRREWEAARVELRKLEDEHGKRGAELTSKRMALPWFRVEKEYTFDTQSGKKTLAELFDGRSQLLAYNVMFGPDYEAACPGCTSLADCIEPTVVHLNHRDVTILCFSRAPIEKLTPYKQRMGWSFPYVSTYGSDFAFDFQLALRPEEAAKIPEIQETLKNPPPFLVEWAKDVGTDLEHGMRENPTWIAFAMENGQVYQTYFRPAPDHDFVVPYFTLLTDLVSKGRGDEFFARRKDEYDRK
jgi:predicted dithiol-disulfide oxidoreductase (DUF899 family)